MSEKILITLEIDKRDLSAFTQAVTQKFESISKQSAIYRKKNPNSDITSDRYYLSNHKAKLNGFSSLYLACMKGLLRAGEKNAK